ncbi:MAG: S-adenosylmethionine:tRNA ribosyltransferase-isomerase, partial [Chloroflexota bacterium]
MKVSDFNYDLPDSFIAQSPAEPRDSSKLMVMDRQSGDIKHRIFRRIVDELGPGDVLVMNNTRVIPARLPVVKAETGGKAEVLLLRQMTDTRWRVLIGGKRISKDTVLAIPDTDITISILEHLAGAERMIEFSAPINPHLQQVGEMPLPPYIKHSDADDMERYQTVYNRHEGSAAAPTAGLHFTADLLTQLRDNGVKFAYCTLHIGLDTFQPVKVDDVQDHKIHSEYAELREADARVIN